MARITWQNVTAPDFSAAIAGQRAAGQLVGDGFDRISDSLGSLDYRNRSQASAAAIDQALQVTDVDQWDRLIAQQGLAGLGINADEATPELLQFVNNRRGSLEADRRAAFDLERDQIAAQRNDANYAAQQAADARGLQAQQLAQSAAQGTNTREEAERAILNQGLDSQLEAAALGSLSNQPNSRWEALPQEFSAPVNQALTVSKNAFDARQRELDVEFKGNATLQLWTDGMDRYSESRNVGEDLIKRVTDYAGTNGEDTGRGEFREATGEIQKEFNRLKSKFPKLPESLIAASLETNIEQTGFGWIGDNNVTFNSDAAEAQLARMDTPGERQQLESIRANYSDRKKALDGNRKKLERAEQDLALALTRGRNGNDERQRILELTQSFAGSPAPQSASAAVAATDPVREFATAVRPTPSRGQPVRTAANTPANLQFTGPNDPLAPTADPLPSAAPAQTVPQQPTATPIGQVQAAVQSGSIPPEVAPQAQFVATAIETGVNPRTGQTLSPADIAILRQQLAQLLGR